MAADRLRNRCGLRMRSGSGTAADAVRMRSGCVAEADCGCGAEADCGCGAGAVRMRCGCGLNADRKQSIFIDLRMRSGKYEPGLSFGKFSDENL